MSKTIKQSANSYAVIAGEVIDKTSYPNRSGNPWEAIKNNGQSQHFASKEEAITWILRG